MKPMAIFQCSGRRSRWAAGWVDCDIWSSPETAPDFNIRAQAGPAPATEWGGCEGRVDGSAGALGYRIGTRFRPDVLADRTGGSVNIESTKT
ncbi:MAG TPA: hypothetical protein VFK18_05620, partial [Luteimonas sp.]|nr:hypothetical protein [Luteimonas sp.]